MNSEAIVRPGRYTRLVVAVVRPQITGQYDPVASAVKPVAGVAPCHYSLSTFKGGLNNEQRA